MRSQSLVLGLATLAGLAATIPARDANAEWVYVQPRYNPFGRAHLYIGGELAGVAVIGQSGPQSFLNNGGGFDLDIGIRFNRVFALQFDWEATFHNNERDIFGNHVATVGLESFTLDGKFFFSDRRVQPFLEVGGGLYVLGDRFSVFAEGFGYEIGGGVDFWLDRNVTLGFKIMYRGVELQDYDAYKDNTYLSLITGAANLGIHF